MGDCLTAHPEEVSSTRSACAEKFEFNLMDALLGQLEGETGGKFLHKHGTLSGTISIFLKDVVCW